ncbi:anti-sigma factor family protein [Nonomuraea basaltis]|uniref:anti-sigma factor family protein n=1 Tax=Nonomuraea basaltis TaxID=2495887 RepID=UPI00110C59E8|nr:zf-HC2 domain-containing protein [Nonomuraea basaltis]TMR96365.1 zf-HC2 domain-containing protein [Nonomuraea basaltis]
MMTCEEVRLALGVHALGALDPEEALEIDTHLATCEACGAELLELEGVASFLGKVSERDVELVASPPRQVLDRLLNARAKRSRRGRMLLLAAASVAVLALGGTVWTVIQESPQMASTAAAPEATRPAEEVAPRVAQDSGESTNAELRQKAEPSASPKASASRLPQMPEKAVAGREFSAENKAEDYRATVMAWPLEGGGTELGVYVSGVPAGTTCRLVVVGKDGRRDPMGTWAVGPETYEDREAFKSTTSLPMSDIARFEVVDDRTGQVLVNVGVRK